VASNRDAVERSTDIAAARLKVVLDGLSDWKPTRSEDKKFVDSFDEYVFM